jgi:hypothetical protein
VPHSEIQSKHGIQCVNADAIHRERKAILYGSFG